MRWRSAAGRRARLSIFSSAWAETARRLKSSTASTPRAARPDGPTWGSSRPGPETPSCVTSASTRPKPPSIASSAGGAGPSTWSSSTRPGRRVERKLSLNILGVGLIADILKLTNEKLKPLGAAGLQPGGPSAAGPGMNNRIDIEAEGGARTSGTAPSSSPTPSIPAEDDDRSRTPIRGRQGRPDHFSRSQPPRHHAIFKGVFNGTPKAHPKVVTPRPPRSGKRPPLRLMADGELVGTPLYGSVLPGELTLLA